MRPKTSGDIRLLDRLLADGRIRPEQYEAALTHFQRMGGDIFESLLEVNAVTEADLLKYIAALHKTRFVSTEKLAKADINRLTLDKVPVKFAEKHLVFPVVLDTQNSVLSVVAGQPEDLETLKELQVSAGVREVRPFVARPAAIKAAINKFFHGDIHAFAILDRSAHEQFQSMLNVYERNLMSEETMAVALAGTQGGERMLSAETMQRSGAASTASDTAMASEAYLETLNVMVSLLENQRADLRGHSAYVARLTRKIAEKVGVAAKDVESVVIAAYLHDLGKMSAYHLTALNVAEYEGHRVAAQKSYQTPRRLFEAVALSPSVITALDQLYERFDGKGVPGNASGKEISLGARVLAITDTYADLTQNPRNPYRKALRPAEACDVLAKFKGTVFDTNLVDVFKHVVSGDDVASRLLADRHKALVVDPDPEETTMLDLRMVEQGFEVQIARNADQAMKALPAGDFDLVVSEVELQPIDGFALLEKVRAEPWGRDLVWVFLSSRASRTDVQTGFQKGAADYQSKPTSIDAFVAKLKQLIERASTGRGAKGVSGSLSEMSLPDMVQVLWHGRKTGALRIRSRGESGELHFQDGNIVNAMMGKHRGEEAFYVMLKLNEGEFALDPNFVPTARVINDSPEALLLEGMRRLDEGLI
jgi:putative nucleotidyltransferase with HDIG domain